MTDRNERCPGSADKSVRDIRRVTRRKFSAEEKIRIVLEGLHPREQTSMERCFRFLLRRSLLYQRVCDAERSDGHDLTCVNYHFKVRMLAS